MTDGFSVAESGEVTMPHTHDGQEEVFVSMDGGQMSLAGEVHDVPTGGVVRVAPETVRSLCNPTDETHVRLGVGAPPVGSVDDFGAYVVAED